MAALPECGFVRLSSIIGDRKADPPIPAMIPISKSAWYAGIKAKKYPQPSHALGRVSVWNIEDIRRLIAEASPGAANEQEG
ncbi:helix-turn-helix transcriptional regulator [Noviluteimonas dokdonensis]|nr:hypothetical protein [Lysobacter dokdonensis]